MSAGGKGERKAQYFEKLLQAVETHPQILLVSVDNVGSNQMQKIRMSLRGKGTVLMGKNTMIRKFLKNYIADHPKYECLIPMVKGNVGFVFCNDNVAEVRDIIVANRVPAAAKGGALAPCDVICPAGPTGMEPTQTSFLQALNIASKISRGQIEIINPVQVIFKGEKVGSSEAALLQKLNIKPFSYGLELVSVFDNGFVYPPSMLDVKEEDLLAKFAEGISNIAGASLGISYPTLAAAPHAFIDAYKNVAAVAIEADYDYPQLKPIKDFLADPSAFAAVAAAPAAEAVEEKKEEEKKVESESEESDDDVMGDLFG